MSVQPEFSRLISIEGITPDKLRDESVEATEAECAALAKRFDLRSLSGFKASLGIRRVSGGTIHVTGDFQAEVVQACVVSLRDVPSIVKGHFETFFTESDDPKADGIEFSTEDGEDAAEMISDGMIDLGEVAAQYLALELDPYPRAPGVSLAAQLAEAGAPAKSNPFQVLEGLKKETSEESGKKGKK